MPLLSTFCHVEMTQLPQSSVLNVIIKFVLIKFLINSFITQAQRSHPFLLIMFYWRYLLLLNYYIKKKYLSYFYISAIYIYVINQFIKIIRQFSRFYYCFYQYFTKFNFFLNYDIKLIKIFCQKTYKN